MLPPIIPFDATRILSDEEAAGLSLKDLSAQTKTPPFRLRAIEEGHQHHLKGAIIARYAAALGESEWLGAWVAANAALASRLRLSELESVVLVKVRVD
ncbi:MAG: hypothetical protein IPK64_00515 [bacterium]|nr:hypothetical protein [bacterium]